MTKVKFKLEIDTSQSDQTNALNILLCAIGGQVGVEVLENVLETTDEGTSDEKPKRKRRSKKEIEADKAAQTEEKEGEGVSSTEEKHPEFTEVRALFAKKLQPGDEAIRETCIAKLDELGAKNLPSLKEEDYQIFIDFLNAL